MESTNGWIGSNEPSLYLLDGDAVYASERNLTAPADVAVGQKTVRGRCAAHQLGNGRKPTTQIGQFNVMPGTGVNCLCSSVRFSVW